MLPATLLRSRASINANILWIGLGNAIIHPRVEGFFTVSAVNRAAPRALQAPRSSCRSNFPAFPKGSTRVSHSPLLVIPVHPHTHSSRNQSFNSFVLIVSSFSGFHPKGLPSVKKSKLSLFLQFGTQTILFLIVLRKNVKTLMISRALHE